MEAKTWYVYTTDKVYRRSGVDGRGDRFLYTIEAESHKTAVKLVTAKRPKERVVSITTRKPPVWRLELAAQL